MPVIDACEPPVLRALQKDHWSIVTKPFAIRTNTHTVFADCLLERKNNGSSEHAIILELKCFSNPQTDLTEFYTAVGQYQFYRAAVAANNSTTPVYLAIPHPAYIRLMKDNAISIAMSQNSIKLVAVDLVTEEVVLWLH